MIVLEFSSSVPIPLVVLMNRFYQQSVELKIHLTVTRWKWCWFESLRDLNDTVLFALCWDILILIWHRYMPRCHERPSTLVWKANSIVINAFYQFNLVWMKARLMRLPLEITLRIHFVLNVKIHFMHNVTARLLFCAAALGALHWLPIWIQFQMLVISFKDFLGLGFTWRIIPVSISPCGNFSLQTTFSFLCHLGGWWVNLSSYLCIVCSKIGLKRKGSDFCFVILIFFHREHLSN